MKNYIGIFLIALLAFASCDSDSPEPSPEPDAEAPGKAELSLPANNKECEQGDVSGDDATVTFTWAASENTNTYDLKVTNLDDNTFTTRNGISGTSVEVSLERGHPYSWTVTSRNSGSKTTISDIWKFYLASDGESNFAPFPAAAVAPTPGATVTPTDGKVRLEWESVQDPDGDSVTYTLYADDIDGTQEPQAEWKNMTSTNVEISVNANTVYYWRVVTSDGNNAATSSTYSFKTTN